MIRRPAKIACGVLFAVMLVSISLTGQVTSNQDAHSKEQWVKNWVTGSGPKAVPFSFEYDGKPASLEMWSRTSQTRQLDKTRKESTVTWHDPPTSLEIRYVAVEYTDFPVVEWTVYFKNRGRADTPILANIQALDIALQYPIKQGLRLHYIDGDGIPTGFSPRLKSIEPGAALQFSPDGGRPTSGSFPYYNLEWSGQGMILAVGWTGQWASSFARDEAGTLRIRAGQELTHLKLHPGEQIRSPMIVQLFWKGGDWIDAQNLWRRWMRAHNSPRPGGKDVAPILAAGTAGFGGPNYSIELDNENDQNLLIRKYADERLKLNYWWMDIYNSSTNFWMSDPIYGSSGQYLAGSLDADPENYHNGLSSQRVCACERHGTDRLVRARARLARLPIFQGTSRLAAVGAVRSGQQKSDQSRNAAGISKSPEPRQPGCRELADRTLFANSQKGTDQRIPAGFQHRAAGLLAQQRRCGSPGHH